MIEQIHMCEFVGKNWEVATCTVDINCPNSYKKVLPKIEQICMCRTALYSKQWWYQLVGGTSYSKWWLTNSYVWVCKVYKFIHPGSFKSIVHVWMRQVKMVWCEFDQTNKNYDKEVPQEAVIEDKKPSAKINLLVQVAELWKKCQSDAVSHRTNECQRHRMEIQ